jgi:DNA-binding transcriptional ArsR family regulator
MLFKLGEGALTVGQLAAGVGVSSSAVTYHVHVLALAGLVVPKRRGRTTVVRRAEPRWAGIAGAIATVE